MIPVRLNKMNMMMRVVSAHSCYDRVIKCLIKLLQFSSIFSFFVCILVHSRYLPTYLPTYLPNAHKIYSYLCVLITKQFVIMCALLYGLSLHTFAVQKKKGDLLINNLKIK